MATDSSVKFSQDKAQVKLSGELNFESVADLLKRSQISFENGDAFLFGPESRGLPADVLESLPAEQRLTIPMIPGGRSLNLANAVSVMAYEAWRQLDFDMGLPAH